MSGGKSSGETSQSYVVDSSSVNAHVTASKQAPPPSRNNTTLAGSAWRTQNENSLPSAQAQSPPGTICSQTESVAAVSVGGIVTAVASAEALDVAEATAGSLVGGDVALPTPVRDSD